MTSVDRYSRQIVEQRGWRPGSTLENYVAVRLSKVVRLPECVQQYRVGRYRVDFAFPSVKVVIVGFRPC